VPTIAWPCVLANLPAQLVADGELRECERGEPEINADCHAPGFPALRPASRAVVMYGASVGLGQRWGRKLKRRLPDIRRHRLALWFS
jgi:hypothetical protein